MAIHAQAVEILVRKSRFEPEVAIGVAEAIEVLINLAQLVTVPILDSRLQELKHELKEEIQSLRLEFKTDLSTEIGKVNGTLASEIAKVNATLASEIGKVNASIAQTNIALVEGMGKLSTEIQRSNANLMRWVLLTLMGSVAVSMSAKSLMSMLSN